MRNTRLSRDILLLFVPLMAILDIGLYYLIENHYSSSRFGGLFAVSALLYVITIAFQWIVHRKSIWFSLAFGSSLFGFLAFFVPAPILIWLGATEYVFGWDEEYILKATMIANVGVQSLWVGYNLGVIVIPRISIGYVQGIVAKTYIWGLMAIYFLAVLLSISTGNYGIVGTQDNAASLAYEQYLFLGQQIGIFALILLAYYYRSNKTLLVLLTGLLFLAGLISGSKAYALYPVLAVAVTIYIVDGKLPRSWVVGGGVAFVLAFVIVSTFRNAYLRTERQGFTEVGELVTQYSSTLSTEGVEETYREAGLVEQVLGRLFYANAVADVIKVTEERGFGVSYDSSPHHIWLAPFYAFIPRAIYPGKPLGNFGRWIVSHLYGAKDPTWSLGITQSGYAFLVNGWVSLIWISMVIGLFQAFLYKFVFTSFPVIYIFLFIRNLLPASVAWVYISGFVQILVILIAFSLLLRVKLIPEFAHKAESAQ